MLKLLIATNNAHKLVEYGEIFAKLPVTLTSPKEEGLTLDPEETGATFRENAIIKAKAFSLACGLLTLADDSGLEVDALEGEPGIYSARYANTRKDDHEGRYRFLLNKLAGKNVLWEERTARFRCVIALAAGEKIIDTVEGSVEGFISYEAKGQGGFGYDPVFFVPEFNKNMAELSADEKHSISHRGKAAQAARPLILQLCKQ